MENRQKTPRPRRGHAKEQRTDCPLGTLGLVPGSGGLVRRSEVFEGNVRKAQTLSETDWHEERLWRACITLTDLDAAFRSRKSELGLRPVFHHREERVDGHLFITVPACQFMQIIFRRLRAQGARVRVSLEEEDRLRVLTGNMPHTLSNDQPIGRPGTGALPGDSQSGSAPVSCPTRMTQVPDHESRSVGRDGSH